MWQMPKAQTNLPRSLLVTVAKKHVCIVGKEAFAATAETVLRLKEAIPAVA